MLRGPVLSQRDQALGALKALVQLLGPEKGSQVLVLVEGLLPQKPASPVPTTPTHAEMVARLHELSDSGLLGFTRCAGGRVFWCWSCD